MVGVSSLGEDGFEALKKLDEQELSKVVENFALITDPLGQELIAKAAGPHSLIGIEDLASFKEGLRDEALARLYGFVKIGVFTSTLVSMEGKMSRVFSITDFGRKLHRFD